MALKCIPCIERIDDAGESDSDSCFMSNTRSSGSVIQQVTYTGREDCVELCLSESRCEGIVISPLVWRVTTCYIIGEHTTSAYWGWQYADRSCFESEPGECSPKSLGCWTDLPTRAIAGGIRFNSDTPIEDCFNLAMEQGFSVFAVQANRECFTSADAAETFNQYGLSAACQYDGRGGTWAQNVYQVTCEGECSPKSLGCWTDLPTRAIAGGIRFNSDTPIEDCYNFAKEQGFSVFAVQANRECFTSADAAETFNQYGLSAACQYDGRGGTWAQNVYQVTCEE
ncbi:uncharacterized protein LOC134818870 isoform X2 [Bolinopsis microptera]